MSRPSIRDQISAKRAEASKAPARRAQEAKAASAAASTRNQDEVADKTVSGQVRRAAKSDIAGLDLERIPSEVYSVLLGIPSSTLARPATPEVKDDTVSSLTASFQDLGSGSREEIFRKSTRKEEVWAECEEITSFKVSENRIRSLDIEIGAFGGLKVIELRNNQLTALPNSFADLLRLITVDLSHNALTDLPSQLLLLPALQNLDLSHNKISSLDMSNPVEPTDEGLGYGSGFLSTSFTRNQQRSKAIFPALTNLNLGYNELRNDSLKSFSQIKALRTFNLEANKLEGTLDVDELGISKSTLMGLKNLNLSGNPTLKETSGNLDGVEVNMEGCGYGASSASQATSASSAGPSRPSKPPLPVPNPSMTLVYRTTPAATFDAEPLNIDFDLYLPSEPAGPSGHPLVIWFHGGGLLQGNKENLPPHFRRLPNYPFSKNGKQEHVAVISPNYRLAPQIPILDILSDVTALLGYIRLKLNDRLKKEGHGDNLIDSSSICLSGGSAGGYLAMIAGMAVSPKASDESVGGYRGEKGIKCIAPFYPITDLEDPFWSTKTDPVPWYGKSVPDEAARPHLDLKAPPVYTAVSGGPRSILYMYMLQHALFPSLLFVKQKSVGQGLDAFRPDAKSLSITTRIENASKDNVNQIPMYFVYGTIDDKVQPMEKTLDVLTRYKGDVEVWKVEGGDHQFDEDPGEECEGFREWLGKTLL